MAISPDILEKLHTPEEDLQLDLSWLRPDDARKIERVLPGRRGLTFDEIEAGRDVPEHAETSTLLPRDARARKDAPRTGIYYADKADVWSENSRLLYEEAVQRQWSSATDIPWETVQPLPDDVERAMCQLCTFLPEVEFIAGDAPGQALRVILDAKDFTEMSAIMHVFAEGFIQSLFRTGEYVSYNEAEKRIYRLCYQDESRHLGFGVMHLKYILETEPWRRDEIHHYLDQVEGPLSMDTINVSSATPYFDEAIIVLAGGGLKNIDAGFQKLMAIRKRQINEYMHRLGGEGGGERGGRPKPAWRGG